ncbi:SEFIR domain-containing protein [Saccharopolyspora shandongensis]|uniref:SEFIR domain-containing protein n=1 Tax=Saccharopolyspora shandongensis TaxID=418495 RepID=UPI00343643EB
MPRPESHRVLVREFASLLRKGGVDAHVNDWNPPERSDQVAVEVEQFEQADFILVIASPDMRRLMDSTEQGPPGDVTHVSAALFRNLLARSLAEELHRVLPVVLSDAAFEDVPDVLRPYSTKPYVIQELTVPGIEELLRTLFDRPADVKPALRTPDLAAVGQQAPAPVHPALAENGILAAGAVIELAGRTYVVHSEPQQPPADDPTAIYRQAKALLVGDANDRVWLRQVELRAETAEAKEAVAALEREYELLGELYRHGRGLPRPLELVDVDRMRTLVLSWPRRDTTPESFHTLADYIPEPGEQLDSTYLWRMLDALAGLCDTLQVLHQRQDAHRELTPEAIVRIDEEHLALRDVGAACRPDLPGAGDPAYQAPEQTIRRRGKLGPWTDVFQLAAVAYHLLSGRRPEVGASLPIQALCPGVPDRQATAIDAALSTVPDQRPVVADLAAALRM